MTTGTTPAPPPPPPPRIALTSRGLAISGRVRPILGGEIQYFRIRDAAWDVAKTHAMWEDALDQLQAAGGTLVTVYIPWDFHEETEGTFDFSGVRDVERFLESCFRRGLLVHFKPGPFINSEWPNGVGSFGAVPRWFKDKHPDSLARGSDGKFFSFDLLGRAEGRQPSFFSPEFRQATVKWFARLAPLVKRYVKDRPTIALLQIDNETNFYFKSRFASDYSTHGARQFRDWLAKKYGSIAALNAAYQTSHASFDQVPLPKEGPRRAADNLPVQDWFDAGKEGIAEYHSFLRAEWERLGIVEPDVLFTTNDSPHAMPTMDMLLWDGPTKNRAGIAALDAYPKQFPWSGPRPLDYPFLTSFFTKRFIEASDDYVFAGRRVGPMKGAFAAELEGGLFNLPLGIPLEIPPATTDHILLEFFGKGGTLGTIYVFRGGLNRDGSKYFEMAPVDADGKPTPRYDLVSRFGKGLIGKQGDALVASEEVESPVALVVGARFDAPAFDVPGHPGWIQAKEAPAIYGWLEDAGIAPAVIDGRRVKKGTLDRFNLVVYANPDAADDGLALALDDYVRRGGTLVNVFHSGRHDGSWRAGGTAGTLLASGLFSDGVLKGTYEEKLGLLLPPHVNFALPTGLRGFLPTSSFLGQYDLGPLARPFAHDRTAPFGVNGRVAGWQAAKGLGQVIFLATSPARAFRDHFYYDTSPGDLAMARGIARWIAGEARVSPVLEVAETRARAFARKIDAAAGGGAFIFIGSRLGRAEDVTVRALDLKALGLDAQTDYGLVDVLADRSLGRARGSDLAGRGLTLRLPAYGTAVVLVR